MENPLIKRTPNGEYSTILLPNGIIETMWFGNDGSQVLIGRTDASLSRVAMDHINSDTVSR